MSLRDFRVDYEKLFSLAGADAARLEEELLDFNFFLNQEFKIKSFLEALLYTPKEKKQALKEYFSGHSVIFRELVELLIDRAKIDLLPEITEKYRKCLEKHGIGYVEVLTPRPLEKSLLKELNKKIKLKTRKKELILRNFVNPRLVGGMVLKFGEGKIFDASIRGRLANLKKVLVR